MPLYYNPVCHMDFYTSKNKCFYEHLWFETCSLRKSEDECSKEKKQLELCLKNYGIDNKKTR